MVAMQRLQEVEICGDCLARLCKDQHGGRRTDTCRLRLQYEQGSMHPQHWVSGLQQRSPSKEQAVPPGPPTTSGACHAQLPTVLCFAPGTAGRGPITLNASTISQVFEQPCLECSKLESSELNSMALCDCCNLYGLHAQCQRRYRRLRKPPWGVDGQYPLPIADEDEPWICCHCVDRVLTLRMLDIPPATWQEAIVQVLLTHPHDALDVLAIWQVIRSAGLAFAAGLSDRQGVQCVQEAAFKLSIDTATGHMAAYLPALTHQMVPAPAPPAAATVPCIDARGKSLPPAAKLPQRGAARSNRYPCSYAPVPSRVPVLPKSAAPGPRAQLGPLAAAGQLRPVHVTSKLGSRAAPAADEVDDERFAVQRVHLRVVASRPWFLDMIQQLPGLPATDQQSAMFSYHDSDGDEVFVVPVEMSEAITMDSGGSRVPAQWTPPWRFAVLVCHHDSPCSPDCPVLTVPRPLTPAQHAQGLSALRTLMMASSATAAAAAVLQELQQHHGNMEPSSMPLQLVEAGAANRVVLQSLPAANNKGAGHVSDDMAHAADKALGVRQQVGHGPGKARGAVQDKRRSSRVSGDVGSSDRYGVREGVGVDGRMAEQGNRALKIGFAPLNESKLRVSKTNSKGLCETQGRRSSRLNGVRKSQSMKRRAANRGPAPVGGLLQLPMRSAKRPRSGDLQPLLTAQAAGRAAPAAPAAAAQGGAALLLTAAEASLLQGGQDGNGPAGAPELKPCPELQLAAALTVGPNHRKSSIQQQEQGGRRNSAVTGVATAQALQLPTTAEALPQARDATPATCPQLPAATAALPARAPADFGGQEGRQGKRKRTCCGVLADAPAAVLQAATNPSVVSGVATNTEKQGHSGAAGGPDSQPVQQRTADSCEAHHGKGLPAKVLNERATRRDGLQRKAPSAEAQKSDSGRGMSHGVIDLITTTSVAVAGRDTGEEYTSPRTLHKAPQGWAALQQVANQPERAAEPPGTTVGAAREPAHLLQDGTSADSVKHRRNCSAAGATGGAAAESGSLDDATRSRVLIDLAGSDDIDLVAVQSQSGAAQGPALGKAGPGTQNGSDWTRQPRLRGLGRDRVTTTGRPGWSKQADPLTDAQQHSVLQMLGAAWTEAQSTAEAQGRAMALKDVENWLFMKMQQQRLSNHTT